jgi:hypothetical protein
MSETATPARELLSELERLTLEDLNGLEQDELRRLEALLDHWRCLAQSKLHAELAHRKGAAA